MIAHNVKALLLCSPHNPVGRVWSRKELERLGDLCLTHHVIILCDEIHCDFVYAPHHFTSFLTLDEKISQEPRRLYIAQQNIQRCRLPTGKYHHP